MTPEELYSAACDLAEKYGHTPRDPKKYQDVNVVVMVTRERTRYTISMFTSPRSIETNLSTSPEMALQTFELRLKEHQIRKS